MDILSRQAQVQSLTITAKTIQSLAILQLGFQELQEFINREAERNPFIEVRSPAAFSNVGARTQTRSGDISGWGYVETLAARVTLRDHLRAQVWAAFRNRRDRCIAGEIVDLVDPDGYLRRPLSEIADALDISECELDPYLRMVQCFDPPGVLARSLSECLRIQLAAQDKICPIIDILLANLDLLANHDLDRLCAICGTNHTRLKEIIGQLMTLNPIPGHTYEDASVPPAFPDVLVSRSGSKSYSVTINSEILPRVLLNNTYYAEVKHRSADADSRKYISDSFRSARWLVRQLDQRAQTLLKISSEIVAQQSDFFRFGIDSLRPLKLSQVASAVGVHEFTVSRAIANKCMLAPSGLFKIAYFFVNGVSTSKGDDIAAETVRHQIDRLVASEMPDAVLSDEQIAIALSRRGIRIARRTVAKYRNSLKIPQSSVRRRQKRHSSAS